MKRLILLVVIGMMGDIAQGIDESPGTSVAPFLKMSQSARSSGMGGVSLAISEGVDGLYANCASLAGIESKEVIFMRHNWLSDVSFNYLAGVIPLANQGIGLSLNLVNPGEIKRTTYSNPDGSGNFTTE